MIERPAFAVGTSLVFAIVVFSLFDQWTIETVWWAGWGCDRVALRRLAGSTLTRW